MELRRVALREMDNKTFKGGFLEGYLDADAKILRRWVDTSIRDEEGLVAELTIFGVISLDTSNIVEVQDMFPKGAKVLLKRPQVVTMIDGRRRLCVEYPISMEILSYFPERTVAILDSMDADQLANQGHLKLSKCCYEAAAHCFTMSLGKTKDAEHVVMGYSSRAECRLRQGKYERAIEDARVALEIDQGHIASMLILGKAFLALQEHVKACEILSKAAAADSSDANIKDELSRAEELRRQSTTGSYGKVLEDFIIRGSKFHRAMECSDFMGPVEVRMTPDHKGRGLFATQDLEPGHIVLVSNALVMAHLVGEESFEGLIDDVVVKVLHKCMMSRDLCNRLYRISHEDEVPSMDLFGPNRLERGEDYVHYQGEPEPEKLEKIAAMVRKICMLSPRMSGVWLLPALVNNSCIPNTTRIEVGRASFFHTCTNVKAGEELTVAYIDIHVPWATHRKKRTRELKFECHCKRCVVETKYFAELRQVSNQFQKLQPNSGNIAQIRMARLAPMLEKQIKKATEEEKNLIRTSYLGAYSFYYYFERNNAAPPGEVPPEEVITDAVRAYNGGSKLTVRHLFDIGADILMRDVWRVCGREVGNLALELVIRQLIDGTGMGVRTSLNYYPL